MAIERTSVRNGALRTSLTRLLALGMLALALDGAAASLDGPRKTSRLVRLVTSIESSPELVQSDFAVIALETMIFTYERELKAVAAPKRSLSKRERAKQWRWASAARSFLDDVYRALDAVLDGARVELIAGSPVEVQLLVNGRMVPVSSPRIDEPKELEDLVLARFCDLHECDLAVFDQVLVAAPASTAGWNIRQGLGSTYVTADGLGFMFANVRDRVLKEELCQRVAAELRDVVRVLKRAREIGIAVEWDVLRVIDGGGSEGERLVITASGQGARRSLPILLRAPAVLSVARPWLEARLNERQVEQLFPRADLLFRHVLAGR